jgi:iron complex outermembrane receptor protein
MPESVVIQKTAVGHNKVESEIVSASARDILYRKRGSLGTLLAVAAVATLAGPGLAEADAAAPTDGQQTKSAQPAATAPADNADLVEIVVSARRRVERVEDVPASVVSLSFAKLDEANIVDSKGLENVVAGLTINHTGFGFQPNIRGIGSTNGLPGDEANVATYVDGVYMSQQFANFLDFPDVERVEVLKGPQGTLFGRNAAGGAISVSTLQPSDTFEGKTSLEYGSFNTVTDTAYVTGPIAQNLSASIAAFLTRDDGYVKNISNGAETADKTGGFAHGKLRYTPSDRLAIILSLNFSKFEDNTNQTFGLYNRDVVGATTPGTLIPTQPWTNAQLFEARNHIQSLGASLNIKYEFDDIDLTSITARQSYRNHLPGPDTPILLPFSYEQWQPDDDWSQEFQLSSKPAAHIPWVAGLYYFSSVGGYSPIYFFAPGSVTTIRDRVGDRSYAAFGETTIPLVGALSVTLGVRYSNEEKSLDGAIEGFPAVSASKTWTDTSPRGVIQYEVPKMVNLYASYNKGFKSGVFNSQTVSPIPVNPETVNAYEIGAKSLFSNSIQISIAAYHYIYKNIQVFEFNPVSGSVLENAAGAKINGGELEFSERWDSGIDVRANVAYTNARYSAYYNAAEDVPSGFGGNVPTQIDATGNLETETPRFTANAAIGYHADLGARGTIATAVNYAWSDGAYYDAANTVRQGPYGLLGANVSWQPAGTKFKFTVLGTNLTNKPYFENIGISPLADNGIWGMPRYVGGRVQYSF